MKKLVLWVMAATLICTTVVSTAEAEVTLVE